MKYVLYGFRAAVLAILFLGSSGAHAAIFGSDTRRSVDELSRIDKYVALSRPIGRIDTFNAEGRLIGQCTAAVISPTYVLTTSFCLVDNSAGSSTDLGPAQSAGGRLATSARLVLEQAHSSGPATFQVKMPPVEVSGDLEYAVLEVEGNPAKDFGTVRLLVRDVVPGESLYLFHYSAAPDRAKTALGGSLTVGDKCSIKGMVDGSAIGEASLSPNVGPSKIRETSAPVTTPRHGAFIFHDCPTSFGSAGALIFSVADDAVIGIHYGFDVSGDYATETSGQRFNLARPMTDIWGASTIIKPIAWARNTPASGTTGSGQRRFSVTVTREEVGGLLDVLRPGSSVKLNGKTHRVDSVDRDKGVVMFLGEDTSLRSGLNSFEAEARQFRFWNEERVLSTFAHPYRRSYAILVAIDDYDRKSDQKQRGPTGFKALTNMVARSEELKRSLIRSGFPAENILTLYDEAATSDEFDAVLGEFHEGGRFADADRLFVYFGGHGGGAPRRGYLVTYDFDKVRPTRTSFPMTRFNSEHFPEILAKHVFVALDSCSSGLALPETLANEPTEAELERFATLASIRADISDKARNLLVAGTGDQKAVWEQGGIFTQALIDGLDGRADFFNTGVIQFEELATYVKRIVRNRAAQEGVRQDPASSPGSLFGRGQMVFLRVPPA